MTLENNPDPGSLVAAFCALWAHGSADELAEYFTDDAIYHNIPMSAVTGRSAIRDFLAGFIGAFGGIEFHIRHQVAEGNLVFNERVDTFRLAEQTIELPVTGVFEIADGRIRAWRDYFDMAPLTAAMSS
ncbi:limonene-1,2-epoxide hydrolase [Nocardia neocaledoniensis NBRC 108232]|uniref:Limonene-1,2-epoxide hydrolase n=1 Tax=Nocardia neocaledoniensis TaxID=236511 RepID=A0A317N7M1_9NOCA|nr:limonene-1,2-epoxide hydrolase family protein [Nocardia neocaledoniensis]PWV71054.1 limonene-1,2-epoxide hydrolase [Nocardia neocaledoniensis]GEM30278.1 limonene-1,2-epoxide hydrolase [Nocardia neocaledoniensis NBRC 108232]